MKKIILVMSIFVLVGCVYAEEFSTVNVNGVDFEIPSKYANGDSILCVDDYIVSNYGGFYKICDSSQKMTVGDRPCMHLVIYNKYIDNNVSYLYFPCEKSVYCICYQGNDVNGSISHIVESASPSNMSDETFYGLLNEAYKEHQNREYLDTLTDDNSDYVSKTNQHETYSNDQLVKWYLLTHW